MAITSELETNNIIELFGEGDASRSQDIGRLADVNAVISHHIDELAQECGEEDEYVRYMRSTLTAQVLPFRNSEEGEQS